MRATGATGATQCKINILTVARALHGISSGATGTKSGRCTYGLKVQRPCNKISHVNQRRDTGCTEKQVYPPPQRLKAHSCTLLHPAADSEVRFLKDMPNADEPIIQNFLNSCPVSPFRGFGRTKGRIEDVSYACANLSGRKPSVPSKISPTAFPARIGARVFRTLFQADPCCYCRCVSHALEPEAASARKTPALRHGQSQLQDHGRPAPY